MTRATAGHAAVAALALLTGALVGGCTLVLHGYWWGLLLGAAATAALLVALPGGWWRRLPFALGWVAALLVLSPERPEGDFLVTFNWHGYTLMAIGVGVLIGGLVGLRPPPPPPTAINGDDGPSS